MSAYTFRLARATDQDAIVAFMRRHWDTRHPLVELPDFFEHYYRAPNGSLRFGLALQRQQLCAVAGYIPANGAPTPDVWVSLWVADPAARGAGLELMAEMPTLTRCRTLACNNIRPETRPLYHFLGFETGRVGHFYHLAPVSTYRIARVARPVVPPVAGDATLALLPSPDALKASGFCPPQSANPYKDLAYIEHRYFHFPRQAYRVYAAFLPGDGVPFGLLCTRLVPALGSAVLRIADYIGHAAHFARLGSAIRGLLAGGGAEYADLYCAGLPAAALQSAGFAQRHEDSTDIIPNSLDPPLIQNTEYYYFTNRPEGFTLFKADGDQDRPNVPPPD